MRWRKDDRQQPDDSPDLPAEEWLSQFRPVRPDALTSADRDAAGQPARQPAAQPGPAQGRRDRPASPAQPVDAGRDPRRGRPNDGRYGDDARYGDDGRHGDDARYGDDGRHGDDGRRGGTDDRRAAAGWETGSGQVAPSWETGSGQVAPSWGTGPSQAAPDRERRQDSYRRDELHRAGPLDDTASQRPAFDGHRPSAGGQRPGSADRKGNDGYRPAPGGQRPGSADRKGYDASGERNRGVPGPDPRRPAYDDRRVSNSYPAGPDARYQARDGRGDGNGFRPDVDPRRTARDGRPAGPQPARDVRGPAYGNGDGSAAGQDPWRPAYEGAGERDGYRPGRPSTPASAGEFARDVRGQAATGEYRGEGRGQAPERDRQRPEVDGLPAERAGFRTDWEVLRAVRDGLRANGDASRSEGADRLGRDGIRPDVARQDVGSGQQDPLSGAPGPERDSWLRRSGAPA